MSECLGHYDIVIVTGATFTLNLLYQDENANPINLTGYTAEMQVRADYSTPDPPMLDWTSTSGAIVLGGALGTIAITGSAETTATATGVSGVYDVVLTGSGGAPVVRLIGGGVSFVPLVTRA
jgi:hypothetical protein